MLDERQFPVSCWPSLFCAVSWRHLSNNKKKPKHPPWRVRVWAMLSYLLFLAGQLLLPAQVVTGRGPNRCPCRRQEVEGRHLRVSNQGARRDMATQQADTIERDVLSSSDSAPVFSAAGYLWVGQTWRERRFQVAVEGNRRDWMGKMCSNAVHLWSHFH